MAHHEGMSLMALDNALFDNAMQRRFHAEPLVAAVELLLHERMPAIIPDTDVAMPAPAARVVEPAPLAVPTEEASARGDGRLPPQGSILPASS
jgi:cyclic beta-1,2-glucan synthetase